MNSVILSVAPVAADAMEQNPLSLAREVAECFEAGAGMVHLHCRDAKGKLTADTRILEETAREIQRMCPIVIEVSTGGISNLTIQQRCASCRLDWVECNSLNIGSVNLGDAVYQNPIGDVRYSVDRILKNCKIPEIEVFEIGMLNTARVLAQEFTFPRPLFFALVLGHFGAMPATRHALEAMLSGLYENFPNPSDILWGITQSQRRDWELVRAALALGAQSVRIGFEDSAYLDTDTKARSNVPLVRRCAEEIRRAGGMPASPEQIRRMLQIPPRERK